MIDTADDGEVPIPDSPHVDVPIPALMSEPEAIGRARVRASDLAEPLSEVRGPGIQVLHTYAGAGWRHAGDRQLLRGEVLARLNRAAKTLPANFGIAVFDAWRPLALQRELFDTLPSSVSSAGTNLVAVPSDDPALPPPHLTGGAIDLTLTWDGAPLALGTVFDDFSDLAATSAFELLPGPTRALRRLLYWTLRGEGFVVLAEEWWHFEFGTRLWSGVTGGPTRYGPAAP